jgi:hypothetical protein
VEITVLGKSPSWQNLTPREAGEHGRRAAARRLAITLVSDELETEWVRAEASRGFGGPVELACEGAVYAIWRCDFDRLLT